MLPTSVQVFLPFVGLAGVVTLLMPGLLLIIIPPVVIGSYVILKRAIALRNRLQEQRWADPSSYFSFGSDLHSNTNPDKMNAPLEVRNRVQDAITQNEHDIRDKLGIYTVKPLNVEFTPVESMFQDYRNSPTGIDTIEIHQYGALLDGKRLATVQVVAHKTNSSSKKFRIEITPRRSRETIVLNAATKKRQILNIKFSD